MADRESFFSRWSRLKREEKPAEETPAPVEEEEAVVDPETLPPIDTLGADSDYRQFLMRGVPAELKRLALRKAWASDPVIANFRGLAEYDWDFNAPGYGQLLPADNIARLCDAVFGTGEAPQAGGVDRPLLPTPPLQAEGTPDQGEGLVVAASPPLLEREGQDESPADDTQPPISALLPRRHGSALPSDSS